MEVFQLPYH